MSSSNPKFKVASCIKDHAWSADRKRVACAVNKSVVIFKGADKLGNPKKNWDKEHILDEHMLQVSGVDWCAQTNLIVTCSHDRNAFVWKYDEGKDEWKQSLVILRINRAATSVKWSPNGLKFAVTSSAKCVPVCHFEEEQDWWISSMIKKHKSSVNCLAWHPNSQLLATGSCDFKCRVFSVFMGNVDEEQDTGPFKEEAGFGEAVQEFEARGWIEGVAWSPSGNALCFVSHDSVLSVVAFDGGEATMTVVKNQCLPFRAVAFNTEDQIMAVGYDFNPMVFGQKGKGWNLLGDMDDGKEEVATGKKKGAHSFWHDKSAKGQTGGAEDKITTRHDNTIVSIERHSKGKFSTACVNGRIRIWDFAEFKED